MRSIFSNMLFGIASATLTTGIVAYADPALASVPRPVVHQARVAYGDLDLHSAAGRTTLDRRIAGAASLVCPNDGSDRLGDAACRSEAIANAHRDLDAAIAAAAPATQVAAN